MVGGTLGRSFTPHAPPSAPSNPSSSSPAPLTLGPKAALGLQGLKGSLQGWGEVCVGGAQRLLGHQTALAKLLDELSANEFETDNEVPFRDTWAEK